MRVPASDKGLAEARNDDQDHLLIELDTPYTDDGLPGGSSMSNLNTSADTGPQAPPQFSLYDADYFTDSNGNIISHDPHLNSDGEALYRFLLSQANTTPFYRLHCRGTHTEHRTRWVTGRANDGTTTSRRETHTETVVDFDFYINASPLLPPVHWSVGDLQPAYRGQMVRETRTLGDSQMPKRASEKTYLKWVAERTARGYPPWAQSVESWSEDVVDVGSGALQSSKTLRQWADEYCASPKYLKEFVYEKVLYGWNINRLESLVRGSIAQTMYQGTVEVDLETWGTKIYIRPDNRLSRMLSNKWLRFLSIILLVLPFVWLFKRFHPNGGGRWEVCGGAYALKRWESFTGEARDATAGDMDALPSYTTSSRKKLVGMKERDWFRKWEHTILRSVQGHYQSSTPIYDPFEDTAQAGPPAFVEDD